MPWKVEKTVVAVFDLSIRQRQREVHDWLLGPRQLQMPEAEWRRMKAFTGVIQFQSNRSNQHSITQYVAENFLL